MRSTRSRILIALLVSFGVTSTARATPSTVLNGSFESPNHNATATDGLPYYFYVRTTPLDFWTIEGPSLAFLDSRPPYWVAAEGNQYLELEGGYGPAIRQTLTTVPGVAYTVRFAYAPNPQPETVGADDQLNVYWDGTLLMSIDGTSTAADRLEWTYYEVTTTAQSATSVLRFADGLNWVPYVGPMLDDVSVTAAPIPAPGAILLGTLGTGLVGWLRRRRTL